MGESKRDHRFLLCPVLQWIEIILLVELMENRRVSLSLIMNT